MPKMAELWQTSQAADDKLKRQSDVKFVTDFVFAGVVVDIYEQQMGQTIEGFGGAFTDAAATVFAKLSPSVQSRVIEDYFDESGLGYTMGRVHINSCDFSQDSYSFDDTQDDANLSHFDSNVQPNTQELIPFILAAQQVLKARNRSLKMLASPWSPPAWMKNNWNMDHSPKPCLRSGLEGTWATYISKWISAYKNHGVPIWAITIQNEPENDAAWEACVYSPEQEADFLASHLGPELEVAHPDVLIFAFDHNKDHIEKWAQAIYSNPEAAKYADGIAYHWYAGDGFAAIQNVHAAFPQAILLPSEATYERYRWHQGVTLQGGDWSFGEGYAHDIIGDLNIGGVGWLDWNLLLDSHGGPNHVGNVCDAAMMANDAGDDVFRHPQFYFIGHFSRYILPGSKWVKSQVANSASYQGGPRGYGTCTQDDGLQATSFLRPDGRIAVVVLNCGYAALDFKLKRGFDAAMCSIPPHSIQTYLLWPSEAHAAVRSE
mmetsp:Transcript_68638/g.223305  ORF Transcript_68638/g.223305 Transcript_68638/m.223305 type:complete len:488 (+) Transcript_68638:253-1716(+)